MSRSNGSKDRRHYFILRLLILNSVRSVLICRLRSETVYRAFVKKRFLQTEGAKCIIFRFRFLFKEMVLGKRFCQGIVLLLPYSFKYIVILVLQVFYFKCYKIYFPENSFSYEFYILQCKTLTYKPSKQLLTNFTEANSKKYYFKYLFKTWSHCWRCNYENVKTTLKLLISMFLRHAIDTYRYSDGYDVTIKS